MSVEGLAKTKYKTFKREVRVLNLFLSYRRLKSLKKLACGIFHLCERKYLIADKQNSKNGLIVLYVLFRELSIHVSSFYSN